MLDVMHQSDGSGWQYRCSTVEAIQGWGVSFAASVEAAEHDARRFLSEALGLPVSLEAARQQLRHFRFAQ
jgi:hypothetical protein